MSRILLLHIARVLILAFFLFPTFAWGSYSRNFSTYFGGSGDYEAFRDAATDSNGNIFVTGYVLTSGLATAGAYDTTYNGGVPAANTGDAFIAKFSSSGTLLAATYWGTTGTDFGMSIEVDSNDKVIVAGWCSEGLATTSGVFQETYNGLSDGIYLEVNGCVARFTNDLSAADWVSYVGTQGGTRTMALDSSDNIIMPLHFPVSGATDPAAWFTNAYDSTPTAGGKDGGVIKVTNDGTTAIATYVGGNAEDSKAATVLADSQGRIYYLLRTWSSDMPTPNGYDTALEGTSDLWLGQFDSGLTTLNWATYLGGSTQEWISTHHLAVDSDDNVYVANSTGSSNFSAIHSGAYDESHNGNIDVFVAKFDSSGNFLKGTFIGSTADDEADGIHIDSNDNIYVSGETQGTFPTTSDAYQSGNNGGYDAFFFVMDSNLEKLLYSTMYGGTGDDKGRGSNINSDNDFYILGSTQSGFPILNAHQSSFGGGNADAFLARFDYTALTLAVTATGNGTSPTPTWDDGKFKTIAGRAVDFSLTASGGLVQNRTYTWNFDDFNSYKTPITSEDPSYTFNHVGEHYVTITVDDQDGDPQYAVLLIDVRVVNWENAALILNADTDIGCDTTGVVDCRAAIQTAINNSGANGVRIEFPAGTYKITQSAIPITGGQDGGHAGLQITDSTDAKIEFVGISTTGTLPIINWVLDDTFTFSNANYVWTASGAGTDLYYLTWSGGNPEIDGTEKLYANGIEMTEETSGVAANIDPGEFDDKADYDSLGWDKGSLYVRLADGADPESKASDWLKMKYNGQVDYFFYDYRAVRTPAYLIIQNLHFKFDLQGEATTLYSRRHIIGGRQNFPDYHFYAIENCKFEDYSSVGSISGARIKKNNWTGGSWGRSNPRTHTYDQGQAEAIYLGGDTLSRWNHIPSGASGHSHLTYTGPSKWNTIDSWYTWQASGSGTNEWYATRLGGNPGLDEPNALYLDGSVIAEGTAGSLAEHTWDWGDNESPPLGYNTIYIRDNGGDPAGHTIRQWQDDKDYVYVVENYMDGTNGYSGAYGIQTYGGSGTIQYKYFQGNIIKNYTKWNLLGWLSGTGGNNVDYTDNIIYGAGNGGIQLNRCTANCNITGNHFEEMASGYVVWVSGRGGVVVGATFTGNTYGLNAGSDGGGTQDFDSPSSCSAWTGAAGQSDCTSTSSGTFTPNTDDTSTQSVADPGAWEHIAPTHKGTSATDSGSGLGNTARFPFTHTGFIQFAHTDGKTFSEAKNCLNSNCSFFSGTAPGGSFTYSRFSDNDGNLSGLAAYTSTPTVTGIAITGGSLQ
jgi:hypothetical protein